MLEQIQQIDVQAMSCLFCLLPLAAMVVAGGVYDYIKKDIESRKGPLE